MTPESTSIFSWSVGKSPPSGSTSHGSQRSSCEAPADPHKLARGAPRMDTARPGFKTTRWTLVLRAGGVQTAASRQALDELFRAYRAPLLAFARRLEADPDRAEDLVQGFFCRFVEKD